MCGMGGQGIYGALRPLAHRLLITKVDLEVEGADAWFPEVGEGWREVHRTRLATDGPDCQLSERVAAK